ncbi:Dabb family protein [Planctomonas psychrotolerans]|uniref:Dabb family protein n=1 Tax=Planctomonas psychrotolerans TaxID=2528712 RepID=UPI001239CF29|nr:Dabb family protein [Planctomonas psychrotolerans]
MTESLQEELARVGVERFTASDYGVGEVVHIVLFRLRDGSTAEDAAEVERRFRALSDSRRSGEPYIVSIRSGVQNSGEGASRGFELGFVLTFASLGDRNFYVGEPIISDREHYDLEHAAFKEFAGPFIQPGNGGVLVFDFQDVR